MGRHHTRKDTHGQPLNPCELTLFVPVLASESGLTGIKKLTPWRPARLLLRFAALRVLAPPEK